MVTAQFVPFSQSVLTVKLKQTDQVSPPPVASQSPIDATIPHIPLPSPHELSGSFGIVPPLVVGAVKNQPAPTSNDGLLYITEPAGHQPH
jgi:hypothetical protein